MNKLLFILFLLALAGHAGDGVERDANGQIISTTRDGVKRDANGKIIETRTPTSGGQTTIVRDANGKIITSKSK